MGMVNTLRYASKPRSKVAISLREMGKRQPNRKCGAGAVYDALGSSRRSEMATIAGAFSGRSKSFAPSDDPSARKHAPR